MIAVFIHNCNCRHLHRVNSPECQRFEFQRHTSVEHRVAEEEKGIEQDFYGLKRHRVSFMNLYFDCWGVK